MGSRAFIEKGKALLGFRAKERDVIEGVEGYQDLGGASYL